MTVPTADWPRAPLKPRAAMHARVELIDIR